MTAKYIGESDMIGQRGVSFVERRVLDMEFVWRPTPLLDSGIDGQIEIRRPDTGEMTNCIIQVQVKATERSWTRESANSFEYVCNKRDLEYWLGGNMPVILVVCRQSTDEAYWVSIKDYFSEQATRESRRILFDKNSHRLDSTSREALMRLGVPADTGLYQPPEPKEEELYSNLLRVSYFPETVFVASTEFRKPHELGEQARDLDLDIRNEWILTGKSIVAFVDLREDPWPQLCDRGSVETFESGEWAYSEDEEQRREFVHLLNRCLRQLLFIQNVRPRKDVRGYYARATKDLSVWEYEYVSKIQKTKRKLFFGHPSSANEDRMAYYRHSGFIGQFLRCESEWYLRIHPTYCFTHNGYDLSSYHEDYLKGIKLLESNDAVMGQVIMWARCLTQPPSLFQEAYLTFDWLVKLKLEQAINDQQWLRTDEKEQRRALDAIALGGLFEP